MAKKKRKSKTSWHATAWDKFHSWFTDDSKDDPTRLVRFIRLAGPLLIVLGAFAVVMWQLDGYVQRLDHRRCSQVVVTIDDKPAWMADDLAREILRDALAPIQDNLAFVHHSGMDHRMPEMLATELVHNGWVETVYWVRRCEGGELQISCDFRRPEAIVTSGRWQYLVDGSGFRLPGKYAPGALDQCGLFEIRGCTGTPPDPGRQWAKADLQSGLELAKLLSTTPFAEQVKAIDVSNHSGRLEPLRSWIVLVTDHQTTIRWGRPVGDEMGLENPAKTKLRLLTGLYRQHGHIDFGQMYVDVRHWQDAVDVSIASADGVTK